ncbi:uncharacterized protein LOC130901581 [Diorhabda carinulata]|uniref:uncharacterized protein LOC130901581 n=1 Tax=Diorhabda carinulata TaxID=1163345 RepID=UPI0025A094EA|nr:uncharacterized protein LOC130901581 [Diorhabda carinulata]XP_057669040.1 uncharacterized protein LOC130901581 [Diorhabda carinulata]
MTRYSIQCYGIDVNKEKVCTQSDSPVFPNYKPNYVFYNLGKSEVSVEAIYGTAISWIGIITGPVVVKPGERKILEIDDRVYYVTGQKVHNLGVHRALVHCSTVDGYSSFDDGPEIPLKIDINKIVKILVKFGVGKIPIVGKVFASILDYFWPSNKANVWDQIKDQVSNLIDQKVREAIEGILGAELRSLKTQIQTLHQELELNLPNTGEHYFTIAQTLIGFEKKFTFTKEEDSDYANINYFLLPMYSAVVNMKILFYQFGIVNQEKLELTNDNINLLKMWMNTLIEDEDGAVQYIHKVFVDQYYLEYETCFPDIVFNSIAAVRQYCALNGFEYIDYWRSILKDPFTTKKPYNTAISYSTHFSRPTPLLAREMIPIEVGCPLQPKLINGRRNKMIGITVAIFRSSMNIPKIQGMVIQYENGDSINLGEASSETIPIDFKGAYLKKLTVWGCNALDMFEFLFTDGRTASCGSNVDSANVNNVFELDYHHIAGIMITNDATGLKGQSASISVSYQLTPEE